MNAQITYKWWGWWQLPSGNGGILDAPFPPNNSRLKMSVAPNDAAGSTCQCWTTQCALPPTLNRWQLIFIFILMPPSDYHQVTPLSLPTHIIWSYNHPMPGVQSNPGLQFLGGAQWHRYQHVGLPHSASHMAGSQTLRAGSDVGVSETHRKVGHKRIWGRGLRRDTRIFIEIIR